jgi:hypothetical protein
VRSASGGGYHFPVDVQRGEGHVGKANRLRRKAREKDRARRGQQRPSGQTAHNHFSANPQPRRPGATEQVELLVDEAVYATARGDENLVQACGTRLAGQGNPRLVDRTLRRVLEQSVTLTWRFGWQPADLARYALRGHGKRVAQMMTDAIAGEMRAYPAATVDESWQRQLDQLGAVVWWPGDDGFLQDWASAQGSDRRAAIEVVLHTVALLRTLPRLQLLCPPPGKARPSARAGTTQVDQRMLGKVRALLAKAESTEFPQEAEALTSRAQQLMARHSIDHALLAAQTGHREEPAGRRLPVGNPYESPKAVLLSEVAQANRCKAVWSKALGFSTVLGFPADLDAVELLFTSLLIQATSALVHEGSKYGPGGRSRTRAFRQSFLASYASRIGERLRGASDEAIRQAAAETPGTRLLPVLASRAKAVEDTTEAFFPELTEHRISAVTDREGWLSGRAAADRADLNARTQ